MGPSKLGVTSLSHWIGWPTYIFAPGCLIINKVCVGHQWQFWFVWNKHQKLIPKIYRIFMVSYSQFTEYQHKRTVFRKLWCVSDVHAPQALCSQRFWQSPRSRTKYICESSIYPWVMCDMLLQPPLHYWWPLCDCWHETSCSYYIINHWLVIVITISTQ